MTEYYSNTMRQQMAFARRRIEELLTKCTEGERKMFNAMYPDGVSDKNLDWACRQIERTLEKKEK